MKRLFICTSYIHSWSFSNRIKAFQQFYIFGLIIRSSASFHNKNIKITKGYFKQYLVKNNLLYTICRQSYELLVALSILERCFRQSNTCQIQQDVEYTQLYVVLLVLVQYIHLFGYPWRHCPLLKIFYLYLVL